MSRKMKDSGIEWIGEIPEDWEITKIKRKAQIYTGNSIKDSEKENYLNYENSRPYIPTKAINVNNSTIDYNNGLYIPIDNVNFKIAKKESTLLCIEGGSAGKKIAYLNQDVCFVNKLCCFESINFNNRYLYYYIKSPAFSNEFYLHISGLIGGVSLGEIKEFSITIPSILEQQKIADFLDEKVSKIDKIIENTKESIEEYKKYKQVIITDAVTKGLNTDVEMKDSGIEWIGEIPEGWAVNKLKYMFKFNKGLSITKQDLVDEGIDVISYGQIHSKLNDGTKIKQSLIRFVDDKYLNTCKESLVEKEDFIFADTSEDLNGCGNCVYINENRTLFAGYHTIILKSLGSNNKYFAYLFNSDLWRSQIRLRVSGIKLFSITQKILKELSVIIPTLEEQQEIVSFLDEKCNQIDDLINKKEKFIEELEVYKKSLIYEYVTGKKEVI